MGAYQSTPDLATIIADLQRRLSALERTQRVPQYTTAGRPDATDVKGAIIFDSDLSKHFGSDGALWQPLY